MTPAQSNQAYPATRSKQPIELLKSGQLLALTNQPSCGLILQKPYHAEYVGPGSAIGGMFDMQCETIHTLGNAEFSVPDALSDRQECYQRRLQDIEMMQELCQTDVPLQRAIAILDFFRQQQFSLNEIKTIPHDVLAKLVGVLPSTIEMAWQHKLGQTPNKASVRTEQPRVDAPLMPAFA